MYMLKDVYKQEYSIQNVQQIIQATKDLKKTSEIDERLTETFTFYLLTFIRSF